MEMTPSVSSVFLKYFLSFALIFLVPFAVLFSEMYFNIVGRLQAETESVSMKKMEQVKDTVDMRMKELQHLAVRMSNDPRLARYTVKKDAFTAVEAIDELNKYKANSLIIDELFLYFRSDPLIYSSRGSLSVEVLLNDVYHFNDNVADQFRRDLLDSKAPLIRSAEKAAFNLNDNYRVLTYFYPIPFDDPQPYKTVIFFVRESVLQDLIANILGNYEERVYILDEHGQVLASSESGEKQEASMDIGSYIEGKSNGIYQIAIAHTNYSVIVTHSAPSGWTYVSVIPTHQFFGKVIEEKTIMVMVLTAVILIGVGTALFLSLRHYKPIRSLAELILSQKKIEIGKDSETKGFPVKDELNWISSSLSDVIHRNHNLAQTLEEQIPLLRESKILRLLKGDSIEPAEMTSTMPRFAIAANGERFPGYFAILAAQNGSSVPLTSRQREAVMDYFGEFVFEEGVGYGLELLGEDQFAAIVRLNCLPQEMDRVHRELCEHLKTALMQECGFGMVVCSGRVYNTAVQVNRSFAEASVAMDYRRNNKGNTLFYDDITDIHERLNWFPVKEQSKFVHGLKQGDLTVALEAMRAIFAVIEVREQSQLLIKLMFSEVIGTLFKVVSELNLKGYVDPLREMLKYYSLFELETTMTALVKRICNDVDNRQENDRKQLEADVLAYLSSNYNKYELSLEQAAEQFRLSVFRLSRLIKEWTGDTFTDYIVKMRISEVKRLLRETDLPIQQIVEAVGYVNVPSFTRKFKEMEGIAPGQFRKLSRKET